MAEEACSQVVGKEVNPLLAHLEKVSNEISQLHITLGLMQVVKEETGDVFVHLIDEKGEFGAALPDALNVIPQEETEEWLACVQALKEKLGETELLLKYHFGRIEKKQLAVLSNPSQPAANEEPVSDGEQCVSSPTKKPKRSEVACFSPPPHSTPIASSD